MNLPETLNRLVDEILNEELPDSIGYKYVHEQVKRLAELVGDQDVVEYIKRKQHGNTVDILDMISRPVNERLTVAQDPKCIVCQKGDIKDGKCSNCKCDLNSKDDK